MLKACASKSRVKISVIFSFALLPYSVVLVLYVTICQTLCRLQKGWYEMKLSSKPLWFAATLIITAVILLAAALLEPKSEITGEWVPLNAKVETAIAAFDQSNDKEEELAAAEEKTTEKTDENTDEKTAGNIDGSKDEKEDGKEAELTVGQNGQMALEQAGEDSKLDINRATAEELDALKGIGPAKAKAIVQDRDQNGKFNSVDDLLRVKGIGEKLLQGIEESIVARP
ncbi:ComEA family DNA-binding protein [Paenibacillus sp. PL91]|uniref:ComEA family DNA-binding protein n=1 Tax=Paenibacillus sp. PL91 TaxID=2729538 RepID=UPI00145F5796|nr:helix-hairpin-helix domain-containing protein [Paenibacillus sp. PL91]MBC9198484.1 helix-hairpin-helix domain-containing protein [Paenibacillus sp. PL91]